MRPVKVQIISKPPAPFGRFSRPVFIVGLPRSGTSLVAGLMHEFGGWVGKTVSGTGENPKGFFENDELRAKVLWPTLRTVDGDTAGVMKLPPVDVDRVLKYPVDGRKMPLRPRIQQIIESQGYNSKQRWIYKAPKITLLWRMFDRAFPNADWIIVRRKRDGFVKSCIKTSFMGQHSKDPRFWNALADEYDVRLDQLAASVKNVYEIQTEDILNGDTADLKSMVMKMDGLSFSIAKVRKFVDPEHWHHR
jgi:hypothetical protein